jgi:PleD family two-component response regulator
MNPERKKILVVDDSSTMLLMEQVVLRRKYEVVKAKDGAQALRVAAEERPDLILLDVEMPNIDGLEACRLLRGMEVTRSTPIIMVTTHGEQTTVDAAFANGATDYVTKPIDQGALLRKIAKCLGAR